jgi:hypothetical protein
MSLEYSATLPSGCSDEQIEAIVSAMSNGTNWVREGGSASRQYDYRFANRPRRRQWPEDFSLLFGDGTIALQFHSATRQERNDVVGALREALARAAVPAGEIAEV